MAPLVTAVAVHDRTGMLRSGAHGTAGAWGLPDLLGMLRPAVVADVELEVHPSPAVEALQALPPLAAGLTALNLDAQRLPPEAATMLLQVRAPCSDACRALGRFTLILLCSPLLLALLPLLAAEWPSRPAPGGAAPS